MSILSKWLGKQRSLNLNQPGKTMTSEIKNLALQLLQANSEAEVISVLSTAGYWSDAKSWRLCGDNDGNFATVGNQQARPEAALVEKIVNSVDARLLNECLIRKIDPESDEAPHSIKHAISVLLDGKPYSAPEEASIADWSKKKVLEQAKLITLAVTGNKPRKGMPCITIADAGEGQSPGRFGDTFLSMHKANKLRIKFVQGKFNMGGTGVLKFCGTHSLQLIISKRNPKVISNWKNSETKWQSEDARESEWGVTIVRRERPSSAAGQVRNSVFKYLAPVTSTDPRGEVLSFHSDTFPIFPEDNKPYSREAEFGSAIKLYEYDTKGFGSQALMKGGLLSRLEALLPQIALPVRIHECRDYKGDEARSFTNSMVGLTVRLADNYAENLEDGYPESISFVVRSEKMTAQIYAFIGDKAESYRTNEGIIFAINGQSHGAIPKTFFERSKVKMGRLAKSLLVVVDCTNMSVDAREDLFMNSRDRLSNGELRKAIEEELEEIVSKHPGLRELRERRRAEELTNRLDQSKPLESILDSILKTSPTLSKLFIFGQRLSRPNRSDIDGATKGGGQGLTEGAGEFESRPHPTYFRFFKRNAGDNLTRNAEIDRRCRIRFETDASNDYFERAHIPGKYEIEVVDGALEGVELNHSITLHNGIASWSIRLPEDQVAVGDQLTIQCTVTDDQRLEPFINIANITITPHDEHDSSNKIKPRMSNASGGEDGTAGTGPRGKGGKSRDPGNNLSGGIAMPNIVEVTKGSAQWNDNKFDEQTACHVIDDGDSDQNSNFTFYINIDNIYLLTELKDAKSDAAVEKQRFIWGNVLIGLALLHEDRRSKPHYDSANGDSAESAETVSVRIDRTTRALGPFLIPMIEHLGSITESDVVQLAHRGDDD